MATNIFLNILHGGLGVSIEGPSRVDINFEDLQDGVCRVTYCPQEPGTYTVNVKFADRHVPGSPFTVKCTGEGKLKESIVRQRKAAQVATVGAPCDLNLKIPSKYIFSSIEKGNNLFSIKRFMVSLSGIGHANGKICSTNSDTI